MKNNWRSMAPGFLIVAMTVAAYWPALHGDFIWDDNDHISTNQALRSLEGLRAIWFLRPGATVQYYPFTFSAWWVGYHLWGLNPLGYHLLTLLLHGCVAVLLWQVLARLKVRGAWLAGAIFALHPVNVMSVAWMTELKNTLSASLALGAVWAYVRCARLGIYAVPSTERRSESDWRWYGLALGLFTLAMLAKTAVSFVPVSLLLITWWQRKRLGWREVWPVLPMVGLAALFGAVTIYVERLSGAAGEKFSLGFVDRVLVSGRSFWFYLGKLFYPYPLTFIYERWTVDARVGWQYLFPAATVALFAALWWWRERIGRGVLVALLHFYVSTSLLILGVVLYMTQYSFVSDHWQYFGCMSVIVLTAAGISGALEVVVPSKLFLQRALCGLLLLLLGSLTWRHARVFNNMEALWRDTLAKNPAAFLAHNNLGNLLADEGKLSEAIQHYEQAIQLKPDYDKAHNNLGNVLADQGKLDEAIQQYERALELKPDYTLAHFNLARALDRQGSLPEAIQHYERAFQLKPADAEVNNHLGNALARQGKLPEAIQHYERALQLKPVSADVHNNLGVALAAQGKWNEAIQHFEWALRLKPDYADARDNLGHALAAQGKSDETIQRHERVLQLEPDSVDAHNNLGNALASQGKLQEAIQHFERALELKPDYVEARYNLGNTLAAQGKMDEAIQQFEQVLQLRPESADVHNNLGTALARAGRLKEAIEHFESALQFKPSLAEAHDNLGHALADQGKLREAIAHFQQALDLAKAQHNAALAEGVSSRLRACQSAMPQSSTP